MAQVTLPLGMPPFLFNTLLAGSALAEMGGAVIACIGTCRKEEVFTVYNGTKRLYSSKGWGPNPWICLSIAGSAAFTFLLGKGLPNLSFTEILPTAFCVPALTGVAVGSFARFRYFEEKKGGWETRRETSAYFAWAVGTLSLIGLVATSTLQPQIATWMAG